MAKTQLEVSKKVDARTILQNSSNGSSGGDTADKKLADILRAKHPTWEAHAPWWNLFLDAYTGGEDVLKYLVKHERETQPIFDSRKKRCYYLNYCEEIVNLGPAYIFHREVVRQEVAVEEGEETQEPSEEMTEFWKDCDMQGHSINEFMQDVGRLARIFGLMWILVDAPQMNRAIMSEFERQQLQIRPYLCKVTPLALTNWEVGEDRKLLWVRICEPQYGLNEDPFAPRKDPGEVYLTYTRTDWKRHLITQDEKGDVKVNLLGSGTHGLGRVPIACAINQIYDRDKMAAISLIRDIATTNIAVFNWSSLIDEDIYKRCLNVLMVKGVEGENQSSFNLSHENALEYFGDEAPAYLTPSSEPISAIMSMMDKAANEMYRMGKFGGTRGQVSTGGEGESGAQPSAARSGIAYAFEFNETTQELARLANALEATETEVHKLFKRWMGQEWEGLVDYPEEFGVELMQDEITVTQESKNSIRSETYARVVEKRLAKKIVGKVPEETMTKINQEIDSGPSKEEQALEQQTASQMQVNEANAKFKQQGGSTNAGAE